MRRFNTLGLMVIGLLVVAYPAAAGGGGTCAEFDQRSTTEVVLQHSCFGPTITYVDVGETVTWRNADGYGHNVQSNVFPTSPALGFDATYSHRFEAAGLYPYFCIYHPGMMGVVAVGQVDTAALQAMATASATPPDATAPAEPVAVTGPASTVPLALLAGAGILALGSAAGLTLARGRRPRTPVMP